MSIIYEPKGKAREYSPLAANFYNGCNHGCLYCYAPDIKNQSREFYSNYTSPRQNVVNLFENDARNLYCSSRQVLFNFMGDPYCEAEKKYKITSKCLSISLENKIPVSILTKGGSACLCDLEKFKLFGHHIKVGATLTFYNKELSAKYENGAANPLDRLEALKILHENKIKTWSSFEPVLDIQESIMLIKKSLPFCDEYKIGKINNYNNLDKTINWTYFLKEVVSILRSNNKDFYVKKDLREAAPSVYLTKNEIDHDLHCVPSW